MGSLEFAKLLQEEAHVAVSPGVGFGEDGEGFVRIALVESTEKTVEACHRIRDCLKG